MPISRFKKITLAAFIIALYSTGSYALDIVYPKKNSATINAKSTFFIGSTKPKSILTINNKSVKVWDDGSFVEVVPLIDGDNPFYIKSLLNGESEELIYTINKPVSTITNSTASQQTYQPFEQSQYMYAIVEKEGSPLRSNPNDDAARLSHLSKNTVVLLEGKQGCFYKVLLGDNSSAWINENCVCVTSTVSERILATICESKIEEDNNYKYFKLKLNMPVAYKVQENGTNIELSIYGIKQTKEFIDTLTNQKIFPSAQIKPSTNNNIVINFPSTERLWGYDCYYLDNTLVFKKRKTPSIDQSNPLKDIVITIDPGHGGWDAGAVGPTGEKEKNINFDVAKKLGTELEKSGAKVVYTRTDDTNIDLYERVNISKVNNSLISISVHANALPDGGNPYIKHGTSTYYYNQESKELAQTIKSKLVQNLGTADDGTSKASFVLTRATSPLSILVEVAYMIHPQEYQLLLNEDFRQKAALSIAEGIKTYLLNSTISQTTNQVTKN